MTTEVAETTGSAAVRVHLPAHLRTLAKVGHEVAVEARTDADGRVCLAAVLDALETAHPVLRGTVRDRTSGRRRAFVRFFVGEEDRSHDPPDSPLPLEVATGAVPVVVVGAMAGG
jgi:molybdopterin synthase sulfur carrier subunit